MKRGGFDVRVKVDSASLADLSGFLNFHRVPSLAVKC